MNKLPESVIILGDVYHTNQITGIVRSKSNVSNKPYSIRVILNNQTAMEYLYTTEDARDEVMSHIVSQYRIEYDAQDLTEVD